MKKALAGILLALSSSIALATNYYTTPSGKSSNDGTTIKSPLDITTAFSKLSPGDTLYCAGGQYNLDNTIYVSAVASEAHPTCIFPLKPTDRPILDFRNAPYGTRGIVIASTSRYVHLKGLTIRYAGKNALLNFGSLCTFEGLDVYGNADTGIQMKGGGGRNLIVNCDSHDNFDYEHGGTSAADFGGNADGYADKQITGPGNTYRNCRAWNNSDDGWDFYQRISSGGQPTIMERCLAMNNGPAEFDLRDNPRRAKDKEWFRQFENGLEITDDDGKNAYATMEHYPNFGNGNGFKLGGARTQHDVRLFQCVAINNTYKGFDQNNNFGVMEIYNCTAFENGYDYGFSNGSGGTVTLKNNVSFRSKRPNALKSQKIIQSHNSWNFDMELDDSDFISLNPDSMLAQRQPDYEFIKPQFARPTQTSRILDKGVFVNLPYSGVAPDLGYYEYGDADQTVATEVNSDKGDYVEEYVTKDFVSPKAKWTIGYVTLPHYNYDHRILSALAETEEFNIMILDATNASNDYSSFDMLIISPLPGSTAIAIASLRGYNKPMLLLKPFDLKQTVWNWAIAHNSHDVSINVVRPEHPIFNKLNIKRNQLQLFSKCVGEGAVSYVSQWNDVPGAITLASPASIELGTAIAELPVGTIANGVRIQQRFLLYGVSEHSLEYLTPTAGNLLRNCCKYLVDEK